MRKQVTTLEGFNRNVKVYLKQVHSDPLIKMKKYTGCATGIGASIDKNGLPVTGLTEDRIEPKIGTKIPKTIKGTRRVLEAELDLPEGTLKNTSPFYNTYYIKIDSDSIELDLHNAHDLQKYLFAVAQSNVANGLDDISRSSAIEFVLYSEEQIAKDKIESRRSLKEAYKLSDQLDIESQIQILAVYGEMADATSPSSVINAVEERIEDNPGKFLDIARDSSLVTRALVNKALDKGILTVQDGAIYHGDITVGHTKDMAVEAVSGDLTLQAILKAKLSGDMDLIAAALKTGNSKN